MAAAAAQKRKLDSIKESGLATAAATGAQEKSERVAKMALEKQRDAAAFKEKAATAKAASAAAAATGRRRPWCPPSRERRR